MTEEQALVAKTARKAGEEFGPDYWREKDAQKAFPREFWDHVRSLGLTGAALPEAYGGSGLGMTEMAIIIENLAASGAGATVAQLFMIGPIFGGYSILRFGSEDLKRTLLPRIASGDAVIALGLTEPNAGTNSLEIQSFAREDGDGWRLNGRKIWTTGLEAATKIVVVARTMKMHEARKRTEGLSVFLIDTKRDGLTYAPIEKLGTNTLSASNVYFDDVRIERRELLGGLHSGWPLLLQVLNAERIATTAGLVGAGELAIQLGVGYANQRCVFGSTPISAYQSIQFPIAQAHVQLAAARLLNYKAAWLFDHDEPNGSEANYGKLLAARAAEFATDRAMQMMGGMGYAKECHIERLWRDTRLFRIAPVSEEMILNFVAVQNLGMPRSY
jgi:acyl-CoA dehydrogenase